MRQLLDSIRQDFGYAVRQLRKSPGFTLAAVACLALGVWLACVVSAVGRGMYRPDTGFARPDRIVQIDVEGVFGRDYTGSRRVSRSVFEGLRNTRLFAAIGEYTWSGFRLADDAKNRSMTALSSGMFGVLGVPPLIGRAFVPAEDVRGAGNVVLLSYDFWLRQFGGDSGVVGRQLRVHNAPAQTIVGVMPRGFMFPRLNQAQDIYVAMGSELTPTFMRFNVVKTMLARLRDGSTVEEAESAARGIAVRNVAADREELIAAWAAIKQSYRIRGSDAPIVVRAAHYYTEPWGAWADRLMALIIGCGLCVVLIACANVANLLLVRGAARRQEIAVRMALGASRGRIVMQLISESVLLSVTGAAVGFVMAFWHWRLLDASFSMRHLFGQIDRYVALTAAILALVLVAVFGLLPALRASSMRLDQVLRDVRRSGMGVTKLDGLLARLVMGSTAGTVMLLASAVLLGLSARDLLQRRRFQTNKVLAADLLFARQVPARQVARQVLEGLAARPGVLAVAIAPLPGPSRSTLIRVTPAGSGVVDLDEADVRSITGGYFSALRVPLVAGRTFTPSESVDSVGLVILGAALAKQLWPGQSAVGKVARFAYPGDHVGTFATVVGVAADVTLRANGSPSTEIYFPFGLVPSRSTAALVRFDGKSEAQIVASIRISGAGSGMLVSEALSLDERERRTNFGRYIYIGIALFAGAGLILVAIGLYGVIAFSVARRTHEIGVRLALGANERDVEWMIIRQGLRMTLVGAAIGLVLSFGSAQVLRGMLPDVDPADPRVLIAVIAVVIAVSLVASYLPGRRAAKLDPMNALRAE